MSHLSTVQTLLAQNRAYARAFLKHFAVHQTKDKNQTPLHTPLQGDKNLSHYFLINSNKDKGSVRTMHHLSLNRARFGYVIIIHLPQNMTTVDNVVIYSCVLEE